MSSSRFERPISAWESFYIATQAVVPPCAVSIVIEGTGKLSRELLQDAVARAGHSYPESRLVRRGRSWIDAYKSPSVYEANELEFEGILRRSFDFERGPTSEVWLIRRSYDYQIIFRAARAVMNHDDLLDWIYLVFSALRNDTIETIRHEPLSQPQKHIPLEMDACAPIKVSKHSPTHFFWQRRTFPGNYPSLGEHIAIELAKFQDKTGLMILHNAQMFSVSRFDNLESISRYQLTYSSWMKKIFYHLPTKVLSLALRALIQFQSRRGIYIASAMLSSLGKISLDRLNCNYFHAKTAYAIPVHTGLSPISIVTMEFNTHKEITLSCFEGEGLTEQVSIFLDKLEKSIPAIPLPHS